MADSEHVRKLMEGVAAWNQWRSEHPDVSIDLRSADLRNAELTGANLREANLAGCNLRDAVLNNADFASANLQSANLTGARLSAASLSEANVTNAHLLEVDASNASFGKANLSGSNFADAKLVGANLSKATCKDATFTNTDLSRGNLTRTDFRDSNLQGAQFLKASLEGADLRRCRLNRTSFNSANLSKANLHRAHLGTVDLADAKLTHANLRETNGLTCEQLTQAEDWATAYRDAALACGAAVPEQATVHDENATGGGATVTDARTVGATDPTVTVMGPQAPQVVVAPDGRRRELEPQRQAELGARIERAQEVLARVREALDDPEAAELQAEIDAHFAASPGIGHNRPLRDIDELRDVAEEGAAALGAEELRLGWLKTFSAALRYYWRRFADAASMSAGTAFGRGLLALFVTLIAAAVGALDALLAIVEPLLK